MYTPEQETKIEQLRLEREKSKLLKNTKIELEKLYEKNTGFNVGDSVFVIIEGNTVSGYIVKRHNREEYDVNTPYGIINNLFIWSDKKRQIRRRIIEDLSDVKIPDELKNIHTEKLIKILRSVNRGMHSIYTREQIKAELKNRPHIPHKREKKIFKKLTE